MARKTTLGRRKIEMKLIRSKTARSVTFSKRRFGIFKKASELCTLTGAEVAIVVFSASGKAFSFGHPRVDTIAQRILYQIPRLAPANQDPRGSIIETLNQQYTELRKQLAIEQKRGKELEKKAMKCRKPSWYDTPVETRSFDELVESRNRMVELKVKIAERVDELSVLGSNLTLAPATCVGAIDLNIAIPEEE